MHNSAVKTRGYILQATYRIQAGTPVVHLYGRLEDGATFLVRDHRQKPHFYIKSSAVDVVEDVVEDAVEDVVEVVIEGSVVNAAGDTAGHTAGGVGPLRLTATNKTTFAGEPVSRVDVVTPPDAPGLRDKLLAAGVDTFEADVRFAIRYLIDRGIKGGIS
ncbi:MAG: hypothetical protein O7E57_14420, partial [Gammaproteobacteria bacterium]|nr:hypothetical protein [Gammaproteobacteria bacterium]